MRGITVGIDASRNRSGGAKAHLLGILGATDPREHGIDIVHVWSYDALLQALPAKPWLIKHSPRELNQSLFHQLWWQYRAFPSELAKAGCDVLLSTDAGTVCRSTPSIVMSRDMLSFEPDEMRRYSLLSPARLRLCLLKHIQIKSLRRASGALFLTHYASEVIQRFTGKLDCVRVIHHGIGENFRRSGTLDIVREPPQILRCIYVSNAEVYKHQWQVIEAVASVRKAGHELRLKLVGGGSGPATARINQAIAQHDPAGAFVEVLDMMPHSEIPQYLAEADIFIFASSCENMPNTLVEAMAAGLPIACAQRGPMPEILQDAGIYFDPENAASVASAIEKLILDASYRQSLARKARELAALYSWGRCAKETWDFLVHVSRIKTKNDPLTPIPASR